MDSLEVDLDTDGRSTDYFVTKNENLIDKNYLEGRIVKKIVEKDDHIEITTHRIVYIEND